MYHGVMATSRLQQVGGKEQQKPRHCKYLYRTFGRQVPEHNSQTVLNNQELMSVHRDVLASVRVLGLVDTFPQKTPWVLHPGGMGRVLAACGRAHRRDLLVWQMVIISLNGGISKQAGNYT